MFLGNEYLPARMSWNYLKGRTKKQSNVSCIPSVSLIRGSLVTFRKGCQSFFANGFLPGTISECWNAYKSTLVTNLESSVLLNCTYYKPHCWTAKGWFTSNQSKPVYILKNPPPHLFLAPNKHLLGTETVSITLPVFYLTIYTLCCKMQRLQNASAL